MFAALSQPKIDILVTLGVIVGALVVGTIADRLLFWGLERSVGKRDGITRAVLRRSRGPLSFIIPLIAVLMVLPDAQIPERYAEPVEHLTTMLTYIAVAWGATALTGLFGDVILARHSIGVADNLRARELETRIFILGRVIKALIWFVAIAVILMTFPNIRTLGATLLASAGLAGIVAGVAAKPIVENLLAGLQIAYSQPIRIDDVVIVEKEFGRIEEITSTYVVVALWDRRRMVLPLTYFITTPFQNWTRRSSDLIGTVFIFVDYTFPVDKLREALPDILKESPLWDGVVQNVQVTDVTDSAMQLRILVSARSAAELWDLQCFTRERLVAYVRDQSPLALPQQRFATPPPTASG